MQGDSASWQDWRGWFGRWQRRFSCEPQNRGQLVQLLRRSRDKNLLEVDTLDMVEGVFEIADMRVRDIMIPRAQMEVINRNDRLADILTQVLAAGHSRYPVVGDNRDEVTGVLLAKDLLNYCAQRPDSEFDLDDILRLPVYVPESKRLNVLLKDFRCTRNHMAIVANEYGGVAGLVTIEDVLEQIVGDIGDEHDEEDDAGQILRHEDGRYTIKALTPIETFNEYFGTHYSDEEFDTIGGLITSHLGRVPSRGETVQLGRFGFWVLRADTRRVRLLEMRQISPNDMGDKAAD